MVEAAAAAAAEAALPILVVSRRLSSYVKIKQRRCTIRGLFVSRTTIMMTNTVGALPIIFRSTRIGFTLVAAIIVVVQRAHRRTCRTGRTGINLLFEDRL